MNVHRNMSSLFNQVCAIIEREFYDVDFLAQKWPEIKAELYSEYQSATSMTVKDDILQRLIQSPGISHMFLITPEQVRAIERQLDEGEQNERRPTINSYFDFIIVHIRSFKVKNTPVLFFRELAGMCSNARVIVLDLRLNNGGAGSVVVESASLFLPPETPVLRVRDRVGMSLNRPHLVSSFPEVVNQNHELEIGTVRNRHFLEYRTHASEFPVFQEKVIVLVDRQCYGCGEVFVHAMKEYTDATIIGQPTAGAVAAAADHDLPEGYRVRVPFAEMRSGQDQILEGCPIEPHIIADLDDLDDDALLLFLKERNLLPEGLIGIT